MKRERVLGTTCLIIASVVVVVVIAFLVMFFIIWFTREVIKGQLLFRVTVLCEEWAVTVFLSNGVSCPI